MADTGNVSTFIKVVYVDETKGYKYMSYNGKATEKAVVAIESKAE